jgi:hypothetical protein
MVQFCGGDENCHFDCIAESGAKCSSKCGELDENPYL